MSFRLDENEYFTGIIRNSDANVVVAPRATRDEVIRVTLNEAQKSNSEWVIELRREAANASATGVVGAAVEVLDYWTSRTGYLPPSKRNDTVPNR